MSKQEKAEGNIDGLQSLPELWESLAALSTHIKEDNKKCSDYPIDIRELQITTLKTLIRTIMVYHKGFDPLGTRNG